MKDLRLELRFKNAVLYDAMLKAFGKPAIRLTSEASGVTGALIGTLLNLQTSPYRKNGAFSPAAVRLSNCLGVDPSVLFPVHLYSIHFPKLLSKTVDSVTFVSLAAAARVAIDDGSDQKIDKERLQLACTEALKLLNPQQQSVIAARFGLDGQGERTLSDAGKILGVGMERARQIENAALRRLRHPTLSKDLRPYMAALKI